MERMQTEWQPDYGMEDAIKALWSYRGWARQRMAIRSLLGHMIAIRESMAEDERMANLEKTLFLMELDNR